MPKATPEDELKLQLLSLQEKLQGRGIDSIISDAGVVFTLGGSQCSVNLEWDPANPKPWKATLSSSKEGRGKSVSMVGSFAWSAMSKLPLWKRSKK